jgi:hypothetical protein
MALALLEGGSGQGRALVHEDVVADFGGFAYYYTRAVVDKKAAAYSGAGVDFDIR